MSFATPLAAVQYASGAEGDLLLAEVAAAARARGLRLAGAVQVNDTYDVLCACDMTLRDLASGEDIAISQRLGRHARGCRLDLSALERAVGLAEAGLRAGCDLVVLNKFGKMEASGRGFRPLIGEAVMAGVPVLVGVNALNLPAWRDFAGEDGALLPADAGAILAWIDSIAAELRQSA